MLRRGWKPHWNGMAATTSRIALALTTCVWLDVGTDVAPTVGADVGRTVCVGAGMTPACADSGTDGARLWTDAARARTRRRWNDGG